MAIIDIGCGYGKRDARANVGLDFYAGPGVTLQYDVTQFPWPIADSEFDMAVCHQVIEHLPVTGSVAAEDTFFRFFDEVWRILKPGATFEFDVPAAHSRRVFDDPTHRRFLSPRAFNFLWDPTRDPGYSRKTWELIRIWVSREYGWGWANEYHTRKHAPRLDRFLCRIRLGSPHNIYCALRKPR